MTNDNGKYPQWQQHLRKLQTARNQEHQRQQQEREEQANQDEQDKQVRANTALKVVLSFLGFNAEPENGRWEIDGYVFSDAEHALRTNNKKELQHSWSIDICKSKAPYVDLLSWYESDINRGIDFCYHEPIQKPRWPYRTVNTKDFVTNSNWTREKVAIADAIDGLDQAIQEIQQKWEQDKQAIEEWWRRVEEEAYKEAEQRVHRIHAAQQAEPTDTPDVSYQPTPEEKLLDALREFISEVRYAY